MTIKTNCPACGKTKAIKHKVTFIPGDCVIKTVGKGCHKCGHKPIDL
jgi:C4-type Zn-finger protein